MEVNRENLNDNAENESNPKIDLDALPEMRNANDIIKKLFDLNFYLTLDLFGSDAKWSLFIAAIRSNPFRLPYDSFPPQYQSGSSKDIKKVFNKTLNVCSFDSLVEDFIHRDYEDISTDVIDLVHWVLVGTENFILRTLRESEKRDFIVRHLEAFDLTPTYIFEVNFRRLSKFEKKFEKLTVTHPTKFGFYGNKVDIFYEILHNGSPEHTFKYRSHGEGIYLSTSVMPALTDSPCNPTWGKSVCGPKVSCVALCEYIDDPYNKYKTIDEYVVIKKDEYVQIRYLLFYVDEESRLNSNKGNQIVEWMDNHRYLVAMGCYGLILASFSLPNNDIGVVVEFIRITYNIISSIRNFFE